MILGMWLLVFGHMVFCYFAFLNATRKYSESTRWIKVFAKPSNKLPFGEFFLRSLGSVVLTHSPEAVRRKALYALESGEWPRRESLLLLCLGSLAGVIWWLLFNLLFKIQGAFLLFSGALGYFSRTRFPVLAAFFWFVFFVGLFVMSVELAMRPGNVILRAGAYQDILFFLADNRWPAIIGSLIIASIITLILRLEGWAWILGLLGVVMGIMSLNVALAFIMGESLGWQTLLWWDYRKKASVKKLTKEMLGAQVGAIVLFLAIYAILRNEFFLFKFGSDLNNLLARLRDFLFMVPTWVLFQTFILLIWGHFRAK